MGAGQAWPSVTSAQPYSQSSPVYTVVKLMQAMQSCLFDWTKYDYPVQDVIIVGHQKAVGEHADSEYVYTRNVTMLPGR
jgi:hypothetical protein